MVDPIKVGVGLSGTSASHKTLTLVVGMTMILDDFLRQWMLKNQYIYKMYYFADKQNIQMQKGSSPILVYNQYGLS